MRNTTSEYPIRYLYELIFNPTAEQVKFELICTVDIQGATKVLRLKSMDVFRTTNVP